MKKPFIDVAAGLIIRPDGSLLLAQRPPDKPWAGWWELPGGKIETGETVLQALSRELKEELDIDVTHATPWVTYTHEYEVNIVRLAFCRVTGWTGEPTGIEGQELAWVDPHGPLNVSPLLPATEPPLRWLRLPDRYLLTSVSNAQGLSAFMLRLDQALASGVKLVQFREPGWQDNPAQLEHAFQQVLQRCHASGALCLVNSCHPAAWQAQADGLHLRAGDMTAYQATEQPSKPAGKLLGVSVHNAADLAVARALNADFAVLGHVLDTPSHPDQPGMGWDTFADIAQHAGMPVFAIGGQSMDSLPIAQQHGAHGIAGIRQIVA
ncbi:MAG: Nudix family hydrolase [Burkholderiaceae bacterium]|nr:Nudix family hydrolase [Burkholderiaceae bacterium]